MNNSQKRFPVDETAPGEVTVLLRRLQGGDRQAESDLIHAVYPELRRIAASYMRGERAEHTLQPTALVHEAYLRLVGQERATYKDRAHFLGVAAQVMRRVLIDHARARLTNKRGGGAPMVHLEGASLVAEQQPSELLALNEALLQLSRLDGRAARVIEMRYFGGLSVDETADALGVSTRTVKRDWTFARAWLLEELRGGDDATTRHVQSLDPGEVL